MVQETDRLAPSRRTLLKTGAGGAMAILGQSFFSPAAWAQGDPRVAKIVADAISVDMHNHIRYPFARTPADVKPDPVIDLPGQMKTAGLSVICGAYCVDSNRDGGVGRPPQPGDYYKFHIQSLGYMDRLLERSKMRRAFSLADIKAAHGRKEPIVIQNSEGAQWIEGKIERVEEAYKRGLRHIQLVHQVHDTVASLGDIQNQDPIEFNGLTPIGANVIKEANRLGMVVDMAHAHYLTVQGALKVAQQPLIVSHTGLNSQIGRGTTSNNLMPRLASKEYAKAVADAGGIVGIWYLYPTLKAYVAEIKEMADTIGVDHVGLGSDTAIAPTILAPTNDGRGAEKVTNSIWPDEKGGFVYAVAAEMLAQGFQPEEISKIAGGNYCRVFDKVTASRA